jgi:hypothetical protein
MHGYVVIIAWIQLLEVRVHVGFFSAADTRSVQPFEAVMRSWRSTYSEFLQAGWSVARHTRADLVTNRFLVGCIFFWELEDLSG